MFDNDAHQFSNGWLGELKWRREEYFIGKGERQLIQDRMSIIIIEDFNLYTLGLLLLEAMIGSRICATSYTKNHSTNAPRSKQIRDGRTKVVI